MSVLKEEEVGQNLKTSFIHIRVDHATKTMLQLICTENKRSQSQQIAYMIEREYNEIFK